MNGEGEFFHSWIKQLRLYLDNCTDECKPAVPVLSARTVRKNNKVESQVNSGSSVIMNSVKMASKPMDL